MKRLSVWIVVLLAALLPLRGFAAVTMLATEVVHAAQAGPVTVAHDACCNEHDDAGAASADADKGCGMKAGSCAAFCSLLPLAGTPTTTVAAAEAAANVFPPPATPATGYVPGGLERPPRTA
ncbi:hypothetical protein [Rubrivivax gelatinosus]|uniref:CopL family metal-binding regulatory protein n=1 Tax=Rubrivivax gelatinosus TaxID=28068 RepID=A0ABS1DVK0_RUBGE|nr:hypothetical protein [Rubrivivax gelatinosus]